MFVHKIDLKAHQADAKKYLENTLFLPVVFCPDSNRNQNLQLILLNPKIKHIELDEIEDQMIKMLIK